MEIYAKVIADSISEAGHRITSIEMQFPRFILPQLLMHRLWSRSCESLRARPTNSKLQEVINYPYRPTYRKRQAGMVAAGEVAAETATAAESAWEEARVACVAAATKLSELGVAKETANRLLEPFAYQKVLVTATDFANFLRLRLSEDAQPEIQQLARFLDTALKESTPEYTTEYEWHLPYIPDSLNHLSIDVLRNICAARCARVSYCSHDGTIDINKDLKLAEDLRIAQHSNPYEHAATPGGRDDYRDQRFANFIGWKSSRCLMENDGSLQNAMG